MKKLLLSLGLVVTLCFGITLEDAQNAFKNADVQAAYKIVDELANQGNARAQNALGEMYASGSVVQQNDKKAVDWFEKSASQGFSLAQHSLGIFV